MSFEIYPWKSIASDYQEGLILGNGASIAFDSSFDYKSLREEAERRGLISQDVQRIFDDMSTTDFEFVLRLLWYANRVNRALDVQEEKTTEAYESVRNALVDIVREVHPKYSTVEEHLQKAADFMGQFSTVISLSYDVLVYWALLVGNQAAPNRFKDCFIKESFRQDWEWFRRPYGENKKSTLVFYPHGNLALGADIFGDERKVHAADSGNLLETILNAWTNGESVPIFVSEGTPDQKRSTIRRSPYLSTVFEEVIPRLGSSVVLHGWAMGENDDHILDAICRRSEGPKVGRFAISANPSSSDLDEYCSKAELELSKRLGSGQFELVFYDRESPGCWIAS